MVKNKVKIYRGKVFMNDEQVGEVRFNREGGYPSGLMTFTYNGNNYAYDTTCYGYSADANRAIKYILEEGGLKALAGLSRSC